MNNAPTFLLADSWMHGGWGWGWMTLMMVVMVLFWVAVIFGVVWLIRKTTGGRPERRTESPIDVLERRCAEGAVSVQDYHARREVLLGAVGSNGDRGNEEPVTAAHEAEGRPR